MFSTSRTIVAGFLALAIAALVFAVWPRGAPDAIDSASKASPMSSAPMSMGSSTFGGKMAESRPDVRARSLFAPPAGGN
ncbi:hypothetical protein BJF95_21410 [Rhizobium oryziradicis]|uniref:Uncharacterized protein n=2 Tax=Rhizobium oryziradicis TaxID=1867956 RepID=A0A1Q8ZNQ1_9HYPH|nr:hypothetical protein BJF95_21410 [Rhizobium oryziradicis]